MALKELLIIIPAYNEGKNIGAFLKQLCVPEFVRIADILVINDASTDDTAAIAHRMGCIVISGIYNLGYGSGLQVGYKYAADRGYRYVIQMDGDGQHDVCNVKGLYEKLQEKQCDIVLGSRFLEGSVTYPVSAVKKVAYVWFRFLIRMGTGVKISDPTTGLQGLNRKAFSFYAGFNHFDDKYPDANMLMQMLLLGYQVEEIPAVMHERTEGVSMHSGLKPILYMFRMVFSMLAVWLRIRFFHMDLRRADEKIVS